MYIWPDGIYVSYLIHEAVVFISWNTQMDRWIAGKNTSLLPPHCEPQHAYIGTCSTQLTIVPLNLHALNTSDATQCVTSIAGRSSCKLARIIMPSSAFNSQHEEDNNSNCISFLQIYSAARLNKKIFFFFFSADNDCIVVKESRTIQRLLKVDNTALPWIDVNHYCHG